MHLQVTEHAQHTTKPLARQTLRVLDPASTYYRYPANRDPDEDKRKSPFKETAQKDIFPPDLPEDKKVKAFVIENEKREFVRAFVFDESSEKAATEALLHAADTLNNYHAMMRIELTGGY